MHLLLLIVVMLVFANPSAFAESPDAKTIMQKVKEALEPADSRIQKIVISTTAATGQEVQWIAGEARKKLADGKRTLLVMLEPADIRGNSLLIGERERQADDVMWWYSPPLRRVRALVPVDTYKRFLDTDFTYADLGFVSRQGTYVLQDEEEHKGVRAYRIGFVPQEPWYYSRIITWVAVDSLLPLQSDFYDQAGRLWKQEFFEEVTLINDKPTPLRIRMHDVQKDTSTEFRVSDIRTDVDIPDELFDPEHLSRVVEAPVWQRFSSQVAAER
jgi:outer membrane lipoprotein-sorting protein